METKKKKEGSKKVKKIVKAEMKPLEKEEECYSTLNLNNYLTSSLSRYGVGVKYALGKLGNRFTGL